MSSPETPRRHRPELCDDDAPIAPPRKRKRKKPAIRSRETGNHLAEFVHFEWTIPAFILVVGLVLSLVGALGVSGTAGVATTLGVLFLGILVSVPVTIVFMMAVGMMLSIEYGRLGPAILKLAAITLVVNGVYWIGDWMHLPASLTALIAYGISFGLFMTQFDLDTWETQTSLGAMNVLMFFVHLTLIGFLEAPPGNIPERGRNAPHFEQRAGVDDGELDGK